MNVASVPLEYRRTCVDVHLFASIPELRALAASRRYPCHDVAYVRAAGAMVVADQTGQFDMNCILLSPFSIDMRGLPDHIPLDVWHAAVIRLGETVRYRVDSNNVTVQAFTGGHPDLVELCRRMREIVVSYAKARLERVKFNWIPAALQGARERGSYEIVLAAISQLAAAAVTTSHTTALGAARAIANAAVPLGTPDCDVVRVGMLRLYERWRRETTPLATIYVIVHGGSRLPEQREFPRPLPIAGPARLPLGWSVARMHPLHTDARTAHLYALSGPSATHAEALRNCRLYVTRSVYRDQPVMRVCAYAPPIDKVLEVKSWLSELCERAGCGLSQTTPLCTPRHFAEIEAALDNPLTTLHDYEEPHSTSAMLRQPHNLCIYVKLCVILFDMCPHLPIWLAPAILEWTDRHFNWCLSLKQRVQAAERVFASCRRVQAARKSDNRRVE